MGPLFRVGSSSPPDEFAVGDVRDRCRPLQASRPPRGGELHRRTSPASLDFAAAPAYRPEERSATLPRLESTEAGDAVGLGTASLKTGADGFSYSLVLQLRSHERGEPL